MSMKHPRRYHKKAARKRREHLQVLKQARRDLRDKIAAADQPQK